MGSHELQQLPKEPDAKLQKLLGELDRRMKLPSASKPQNAFYVSEFPEVSRAGLLRFLKSPLKIRFVPECDYKNFFFTLDDMFNSKVKVPEMARTAQAILAANPESHIIFFLGTENGGQIMPSAIANSLISADPSLAAQIMNGRVKFRAGAHLRKPWAQDRGEPAGKDSVGRPLYAVGLEAPAPFSKSDAQGIGIDDTLMVPAVIDGGNLTKAISGNGGKLVIIGSNNITQTKAVYLHGGHKITDDGIRSIYLKAFGADASLVLPDAPAPLAHFDQVVCFPAKGVALLIKPEEDGKDILHSRWAHKLSSEEKKQVQAAISAYKRQLEQAGFRVVEIPTTFSRIAASQSYVNAVPVHGRSGSVLIMPSFGDSALEKRIEAIINGLGMKALFVPDGMFEVNGNVHCLTGALSFNELVPKKQAKTA